MKRCAQIQVNHSADLWFVKTRQHNGVYWHSTEDGAIEEAMLWGAMLRPAEVVVVDGGRRELVARYGLD